MSKICVVLRKIRPPVDRDFPGETFHILIKLAALYGRKSLDSKISHLQATSNEKKNSNIGLINSLKKHDMVPNLMVPFLEGFKREENLVL